MGPVKSMNTSVSGASTPWLPFVGWLRCLLFCTEQTSQGEKVPLCSKPLSAVLFNICRLWAFRWPMRLCQRLTSFAGDMVIVLSADANVNTKE